jgi:hypothetical protein
MPGRRLTRNSPTPYDIDPVRGMPSPADFDPYRTAIADCHCKLCVQMSYANRDAATRRADAVALLESLRAGTHTRVEFADYIAAAKRDHAERLTAECTGRGDEFKIFCMTRLHQNGREQEMFYGLGSTYSLDFYTGIGVGVTPGRHAQAMRWWTDLKARKDAERAARVPGLVAKDGRNACVAYRVAGELCTGHAHLTASPAPDDPADEFVSGWAMYAAA